MFAVDEIAARQLICEMQRNERPARDEDSEQSRDSCVVPGETGAEITRFEPREEFGRRRRR
jgi:hypothetical protein